MSCNRSSSVLNLTINICTFGDVLIFRERDLYIVSHATNSDFSNEFEINLTQTYLFHLLIQTHIIQYSTTQNVTSNIA